MNINNKTLKKAGIWIGSILGGLYVLFLVTPLFLTGILNSYSYEISKIVQESSGFRIKLEKMKIVTTPKLTAGLKVGHAEFALPTNEKFLEADNFQIKLSLLPLLLKKIEVDVISAETISASLKVRPDGKFLIEEFIPQSEIDETYVQSPAGAAELPFCIKISNHLPDLRVKSYNVNLIDMRNSKEYSVMGNDLVVKDFIVNKKIKVSTNGKIDLVDRTQFTYNIKLFNKLMPDIDINDLITSTPESASASNKDNNLAFNIIDIFDAIYKNHLGADIVTDIKTFGDFNSVKLNGNIDIDNITLAVNGQLLPKGEVDVDFSGNKIIIDSEVYTAENEKSELDGIIKHGKTVFVDLDCKSNADLSNIIAIVNSVLKSFNINDLATLSATGKIDADFNVKSDMKKIMSDGYLKIPAASLNYGLYNVAVKDINADVDFSNNMVNIKNAGFNIVGQPLKIYGKIENNSDTDLHITATNLLIKTLLAAAGQVQILKENDIKSGTLSMDASLKGKLLNAVPQLNLNVNNVDILNKPSNTSVKVNKTNLAFTSDGKNMDGLINLFDLKIINPLLSVIVPEAKVEMDENDISILNTSLLFNNSRIDIAGKISDYISNKIAINITANGDISSTDLNNLFPADLRKDMPAKGKMPLAATITGNSKVQDINLKITATPANYFSILSVDVLDNKNTIINSSVKISDDNAKFSNTGIYVDNLNNPVVTLSGGISQLSSVQKLNLNISIPKQIAFNIPGFKDSKISAKGDIAVNGTPVNLLLKGNALVSTVEIPEMDFVLENLDADINGSVLNGYATVKKLKSGGIIAENLAADFSIKNYETLYLKNITGDAFEGKISGAVSYGILTGKAGVDFAGKGMNADIAIEGAAGIKNALSGKLDFLAKIAFQGVEYNDMMKSLTGKVTFDIKDGTFGNIGRFDSFLNAQNVLSNNVLNAAVATAIYTPTIKKTADFKSINGEMAFNNGWADISSIKSQGPLTSYYINGKYNLLNGTANVIILGRLSSEVVSLLGPLGDLSVDKLTSYIPKFGTLTGILIKGMTANPATEKVSMIPPLTTGDENAKNFKVEFNGGVESNSSVKSFKWLSECDTSELDKIDLKKTVTDVKTQLQDASEQKKIQFKDAKDAAVNDAKQQLQDAKEDLKNLFKF